MNVRGTRRIAVLFLPLLLAACGGGAGAIVPAGGPGTAALVSSGEYAWALQVLDLTNAERAAHGLSPVVLDEKASWAAYDHAWDMDLRDFFDHENPDGEGPADRLERHGVDFEYAGENIARGHSTPEEVVKAWMDSPSHRVNILYPWWTHVGISVHSGPDRGPWWAQEFFR